MSIVVGPSHFRVYLRRIARPIKATVGARGRVSFLTSTFIEVGSEKSQNNSIYYVRLGRYSVTVSIFKPQAAQFWLKYDGRLFDLPEDDATASAATAHAPVALAAGGGAMVAAGTAGTPKQDGGKLILLQPRKART